MSPLRRSARVAVVVLALLLAAGTAPAGAAPDAARAGSGPAVTAATGGSLGAPGRSRSERRTWIRSLRKLAVAHAMSRQGSSYVWGGSGPDEFDCSGLVMWVYQQMGIALPHYSGAQMDVTVPVERDRLRRGDLLFYGPDGSRHVAMYIGKGLQIGANNPRTGIVIDSIDGSYWAASYAGAGRVIR